MRTVSLPKQIAGNPWAANDNTSFSPPVINSVSPVAGSCSCPKQ